MQTYSYARSLLLSALACLAWLLDLASELHHQDQLLSTEALPISAFLAMLFYVHIILIYSWNYGISLQGITKERTLHSLEEISDERNYLAIVLLGSLGKLEEVGNCMDPLSASEAQECIRVLFSMRSLITRNACEGPRFSLIRFNGSFDTPLGRYLQNSLFDQIHCCKSCGEPTEAHIISFTHHQGNLTINVRRVPSLKLGGEEDGKIWTWYRCSICEQIDGIPRAARRTVMTDSDLELSFGKFLELGFSNYSTANNLASCGHSLQRDCLQYFGFGSIVALFQYSALKVFSVCLPTSSLDFNDEARLMVPQNSNDDGVIAVCDNEPASIISYALTSKEYEDRIGNASDIHIGSSESCSVPDQQSYGSENISNPTDPSISDYQKTSPHPTISFGKEFPNVTGMVKFSVTCYFAKQFVALRKRCCPGELDFLQSLSRCRAQGEEDNAVSKSFGERFILKQVTKTELESFQEFAPAYFKYLIDSLCSRLPTCLTKILGIYQVTRKPSNEDKEIKTDLMVMENPFFKRKITGFYSVKDSARSHCISKINEVSLDMNISETIPRIPIFLGSKAKRTLQRAVWNDTSFLHNIDITDYSLLLGVDEECQELVVGIIDVLKNYTSGKYLETWIKAYCVLGGTENAPILPPQPYKKKFRKTVDTSLIMVPDDWGSS